MTAIFAFLLPVDPSDARVMSCFKFTNNTTQHHTAQYSIIYFACTCDITTTLCLSINPNP